MMPLVAVVISGLSRRLKHKSRLVQEKNAMLLSLIDETMEGLKIIKAYTAIPFANSRFSRHNRSYTRQRTRMFRRIYLASPVSDFLGNCVVVGIMLFGAALVFSRDAGLTPELFVSYVMMFVLMIPPAKELSTALSQIKKGRACADRIEQFLALPDDTVLSVAPQDSAEHGEPRELDERTSNISTYQHINIQHISFNSVAFRYSDTDPWVLRDLSFTLSPGRMTALVGDSGSGKSTIVDLLLRFYTPQAGSITIGEHNLQDIPVARWRQAIGVVTQDSQLIDGTVADNIAYGLPRSTPQQIEAAARMACAHDFIMQLPDGYATRVAQDGGNLSGGQRQRICIARALLRQPRLLILDEATSALDAESESFLKQTLASLRANSAPPAMLVIAHRLGTVVDADEILTLDQGRIVERGTHGELMRRGGRYAALARLQHLATLLPVIVALALSLLNPRPAMAQHHTDTMPLPLTVLNLGDRAALLQWDSVAPRTTPIRILRQLPHQAAMRHVATAYGTSHVDSLPRLICSDTVRYRVECTVGGTCYISQPEGAFFDDPYPTSPCTLHTVSVDSATQRILLTWHPSPDTDILGYFICSGSPCMGLDTVWGRTDTTYWCTTLASNSIHTFRIYAFDSCLTASPLTEAANNMLLSVQLDDCELRYRASWNAYRQMPDTLEGYELQACPAGGTFTPIAFIRPDSLLEHRGEFAQGTEAIALRMAALGRGGRIKAYSNIVELHPAHVPRASHLHICKLAMPADGKAVEIGCDIDTSYHDQPYILWRRDSEGTWSEVQRITSPSDRFLTFRDTAATALAGVPHYQLSVNDGCNLHTQLSNEASSIALRLDNLSFTANRLEWDACGEWPASPLYNLFSRQKGVSDWQLITVTQGTQYTDDLSHGPSLVAPLQYMVMAIASQPDSLGRFDTLQTAPVQYDRDATVYIPNAFTPDRPDNATFCVQHTFLMPDRYSLTLFSRAGLRVFHSDNPDDCWDGTHGGIPMPQGTYTYFLTYCQSNGDCRTRKGTVLLIR